MNVFMHLLMNGGNHLRALIQSVKPRVTGKAEGWSLLARDACHRASRPMTALEEWPHDLVWNRKELAEGERKWRKVMNVLQHVPPVRGFNTHFLLSVSLSVSSPPPSPVAPSHVTPSLQCCLLRSKERHYWLIEKSQELPKWNHHLICIVVNLS